ncbi:MAG: hypothetical protein P0Y53_22680 [Candidatus Pseudobacter hemicellulosilyticus]|uniref:Adhesin domain-containing protein n=1 Tax=Candidatus Pseudobacter hemicellulosilyticus TaxID=3121375 RepID=A0AAJ5WRE1_9BACT|nr:MAG: hypothetical protein P0Y53_22680 [Pseudobacter sp.]
MTKLYKLFFVLLALCCSERLLAGDDDRVEKTKTYSKAYPVGDNERITLENKFGDLQIKHWNKNEVQVDVTITARASTDDRAAKILDNISIIDGKNSSGVFFRTKTGENQNQKWNKGEKQGFQIDYIVHLPAQNPLSATNEFGPLTIDNHSGEITLVSKFGSLSAGKLSQVKKIYVEFGKASITSVNNGNINIKFSPFQINYLDGSVEAHFEHCSSGKLGITNNVNELNINNSFTPLLLDVSQDLNASFDISTSFAEVKNKTSFPIKKEGEENKRGPQFDFRYSGKTGNGRTNMKIKTSFGEITLGHNLPFNVEEPAKKSKKTTRDI